MNKTKIIVIAGATASGKTSLGISVAQSVNGEIISADSMQVYKGMSIATASPTIEEQTRVPHHLVEFLDSSESFSVARWCELAREKIDDITSRGKTPVIVGGTGLFIDSLVDNITFEDIDINKELRESLMKKDNDELYSELLSVDRQSAESIHPNNKKRVVRALELYYSGVSKTQQNINSKMGENPYEVLYFVIDYENRQVLYDRINRRVELMAQSGLADEAQKFMSAHLETSAQAIGHKELKPYLNGECSLDDALDKLKQETRHYAKRQITWFKRRENATRLVVQNDVSEVTESAIKQSKEFING